MLKKFISIQEASKLSNKSVQTIRRALRSKKLKFRKQSTPQGFNYLVSKESLFEIYKIKINTEKIIKDSAEPKVKKSKKMDIKSPDLRSIAENLERMLSQHTEERQNFLRLINTLQEKIFVLENQLNLLKSPSKKWYSFWK